MVRQRRGSNVSNASTQPERDQASNIHHLLELGRLRNT